MVKRFMNLQLCAAIVELLYEINRIFEKFQCNEYEEI